MGRLIPAGTGGATKAVRKIALDRDTTVIEDARAEAEAAALLAAPAPAAVEAADDVFSSTLVETPESDA